MASLFDDSDESDTEVAATTSDQSLHFHVVYVRVLSFVTSASQVTLLDLEGDAPAKLADNVDLVGLLKTCIDSFTQVKSPHPVTSTAKSCLEACSNLSRLLWQELTRRKAWPHKAWTEAFIFVNLMAACCHLVENNSAESIKFADYAFMVGAPKQETNLLFRLVDPANRGPPPSSFKKDLLDRSSKDPYSASDFSNLVSKLSPYISTTQLVAEEKCQTSDLHALEQLCNGGDTPRVFGGFTDGWAAMDQWRSLDYFLQFGHRIVPVEVGNTITGMEERALPLEEFVRDFLAPSCRGQPSTFSIPAFLASHTTARARQVGYLAQHNIFEQIPELQRDFSVPRFCSHNGRQLSRASIWLGTQSTVTLLHYDSYNNFLVQVAGYKYVVLFPKSETQKLYASQPQTDELLKQGNTSAVNIAQPDLGCHPLYAQAKGFAVLLEPGDALYIPRGMWHYVQALTPSLSVNFWMTYPTDK